MSQAAAATPSGRTVGSRLYKQCQGRAYGKVISLLPQSLTLYGFVKKGSILLGSARRPGNIGVSRMKTLYGKSNGTCCMLARSHNIARLSSEQQHMREALSCTPPILMTPDPHKHSTNKTARLGPLGALEELLLNIPELPTSPCACGADDGVHGKHLRLQEGPTPSSPTP